VVGDLCFDACFSQLEPKTPSGGGQTKTPCIKIEPLFFSSVQKMRRAGGCFLGTFFSCNTYHLTPPAPVGGAVGRTSMPNFLVYQRLRVFFCKQLIGRLELFLKIELLGCEASGSISLTFEIDSLRCREILKESKRSKPTPGNRSLLESVV
jgi:hypothetical protein